MTIGMSERYTRIDAIYDAYLRWSVYFLAVLGPILLIWLFVTQF